MDEREILHVCGTQNCSCRKNCICILSVKCLCRFWKITLTVFSPTLRIEYILSHLPCGKLQLNMITKYFTKRYYGVFTHSLNNLTLQINVPAQTRKLLHTSVSWRERENQRNFPAVYYYQSPLQWLKIKWQMLKLRKWDRDFSQEEFSIGSSYAIATVTHKIRFENYNDLEGLLTPFALSKLKRDILVLWNDEILRNISLKLSDIRLAVPTKVHLHTSPLTSAKVCDIDMWFMAMKWQDPENTALLIIDVVARFSRDFTDADWTISFFELRKYHVQNYNDQPGN